MLDRAWATLEIKSHDADARVIEGIATTPTADRGGDIVEPLGAQFTLPIPLLWQHNQGAPIGEVTAARVTPVGIFITAKFARIDEPGPLRDRLEEAWHSVKAGLVRGLSIGYKAIDAVLVNRANPFGGKHVRTWWWAELSAVTVSQNLEASILNIKSAAMGDHTRPGVSGPLAVRVPMTATETIQQYETSKTTKLERMRGLMDAAGSKGETLDARGLEEYDGLAVDVKNLDAHLTRARELETLNLSQARPVGSVLSPRVVSVSVKANVPTGTAFVRYACAKAVCKGNLYEAAEYAQRWADSTPEVALALKAAIAPGTVTDATWAAPLVNQNISSDFLALLRPATILGKIPGLRVVPFNTKVPVQSGGGTYGWVGEAKPKPLTKLAFTTDALGINKVAGIIVLTKELVRLSNPAAEDLARGDMVAGIAQFLDAQFIDPAVAAVAGINPASITNGAPTAAATASPLADLMGLINHFASNNVPVAGLAIILSAANALSMSFRTNSDGSPLFPGVGMDGGNYKGITFVTSQAAGGNVIALQPSLILYADEGGVTIDMSEEASLQMDNAPASPADATTVYVSLWQTNCVGLRAERYATWKRANANAVKYLTAAAYPAPASDGGTTLSATVQTSRGKKDE